MRDSKRAFASKISDAVLNYLLRRGHNTGEGYVAHVQMRSGANIHEFKLLWHRPQLRVWMEGRLVFDALYNDDAGDDPFTITMSATDSVWPDLLVPAIRLGLHERTLN
jgi:hypothetical protein